MIKVLFYTLSLITLLSCQNKPTKIDSNSKKIEQSNLNKEPKKIDLEKVDYKSYCGKTLGELLENETLKNYDDYYFVDEPPFLLAFTTIKFQNTNKVLSVSIGNLTHQKRFNGNLDWSFELLKKEKFKTIYINENDWSDKLLFSCHCEE